MSWNTRLFLLLSARSSGKSDDKTRYVQKVGHRAQMEQHRGQSGLGMRSAFLGWGGGNGGGISFIFYFFTSIQMA